MTIFEQLCYTCVMDNTPDLTTPENALKPGGLGTVILTAFQVKRSDYGMPFYEQFDQRFTIHQHPDGDDQETNYLDFLCVAHPEQTRGEVMILRSRVGQNYTTNEGHHYTPQVTWQTRDYYRYLALSESGNRKGGES